MPNFSYGAIDATNSYKKGIIQAKTKKAAMDHLQAAGLMVVGLNKEKGANLFSKLSEQGTIKRLDKILFSRHLHALLESGIALDQAIKICSDQATNPRFKKVLTDIYENVRKGSTFYNALLHHRKHFSDFYINLIKVGEASGTLDDVVGHLLEQQEQDYELISKTRGAMIYPAVIIVAAITIVVLMMAFVIPSITSLLKEYNVDLPITTKILIFVSDSLANYGIFIGAFVILATFGIYRYVKTPKGKYTWDDFKLKIPVLNSIVKEFNLARFSRSMSALLKSGVSIDEALILTASICSNVHYANSIQSSVGFVRKGIPLTEVLNQRPKLYPAITTRMLEVGERTGKMDHMFTRLAMFYEKSVLNTINNLSSIIEPLLLLMIGIGVGFIAVSILTPIWKFAQTI